MRSLLRAQEIPGQWEWDCVCSDSSLQIHQNYKKKKKSPVQNEDSRTRPTFLFAMVGSGIWRSCKHQRGSGNRLVLWTTAWRWCIPGPDIYFIKVSPVSQGRIFIYLVWWEARHQHFFIIVKIHNIKFTIPVIFEGAVMLTICTLLCNKSLVFFLLANLNLYIYQTIIPHLPYPQVSGNHPSILCLY